MARHGVLGLGGCLCLILMLFAAKKPRRDVRGGGVPSSLTFAPTSSTSTTLAVVDYGKYVWPRMRFATAADEAVFGALKSEPIKTEWFRAEFGFERSRVEVRPDYTLGQVPVTHGVAPTCSEVCGWDDAVPTRSSALASTEVVCPVMAPNSAFWQHFIDAALPKLLHALPTIQKLDAVVLVRKARDPIIVSILDSLPIRWRECTANEPAAVVIDPCNAPKLHPVLWQRMRKVVTSAILPDPDAPAVDVALIVRGKTRNGGRMLLNLDALVGALQAKYTVAVVDPATMPMARVVGLVQRCRVILGVHGGGMFNMLFSPPNVSVVEMAPYRGASNFLRHPGGMVYIFASLLGNPFTRIMVESRNSDVEAPLEKVLAVLKTDIGY